jgi:peptidoglycan/LPS O-acetylase OafA/YrhL
MWSDEMHQSKLDYVDALRGIAILGVIWLHFTGDTLLLEHVPEKLRYLVQQGGGGVQLFFLASAFTLFRSAQFRMGKEAHATRNFFIRRVFRIVPMYYVGIAYYLWQNGTGPQPFLDITLPNSPANVVGNLFFLQGVNPYWQWLLPGSWSIATEMAFYLLVPLLVHYIRDLQGAIRFVLIALVLRVLITLALRMFPLIPDGQLWDSYLYFFLPSQLPVFGLGIVMYFLVSQELPRRIPTVELSVLTLVLLAQWGSGTFLLLPHHFEMAFAFLLMALVLRRLSWDHIPGKVLRHIGKVSFSLYVCHWAVLYWFGKAGWLIVPADQGLAVALLGYLVRFAAVLAAATLLSTLTYRLVELPGIRLGERLVARLNSTSHPSSPTP